MLLLHRLQRFNPYSLCPPERRAEAEELNRLTLQPEFYPAHLAMRRVSPACAALCQWVRRAVFFVSAAREVYHEWRRAQALRQDAKVAVGHLWRLHKVRESDVRGGMGLRRPSNTTLPCHDAPLQRASEEKVFERELRREVDVAEQEKEGIQKRMATLGERVQGVEGGE